MTIQDLLSHSLLTWGLLVAAFLLLSWGLVNWLRDQRLWIILGVTGVAVVWMLPPKEKLKKGIDLAGGTILVYQVDTANRPSNFQIDQMTAVLSKRINPAGTTDVTIRPIPGVDRVEIILPAADPSQVAAIKDQITRMGQLEFRILANEKHDGTAIRQARERLRNESETTLRTGIRTYQWVKLNDPDSFHPHSENPGESAAVQDGYVLTIVPDELMHVTGEDLSRVEPTTDEHLQPAVGFHFQTEGTAKFGRLTRKYKPEPDGFKYRLAILLDNRVQSAPVIQSAIEGGSGVIEGGRGGFSPQEVDNLVAILNAGQLPAMMIPTPISEDTVTAALGDDTIRQATWAITVAMIAVPVFMLAYYWFSGLVADLALTLNVILILGFMGFSQSTFTLPGLAGLALTIGMAVDANVLIFERMREERERGSSLNQAIRNGFDRAWFAIFDSNLTTIITAAILYMLGRDQIKGFSLTLMIGLVANLFTAVFVSRVLFEIWMRRGWLTELKMLHLFKTPNFDYVKLCYYCVAGSVALNILALAVTFARGSSVLDIDFTGGTAISVRLTDPTYDTDFVRAEAVKILPDVRVENLKSAKMFLIRTTNSNQKEVRAAVVKRFRDELGMLATVKIDDWKPEPTTEAETNSRESPESQDKGVEPNRESTPSDVHRVRLTLNEAVVPDALADKFDEALAAKGVSEPKLHYKLRPAGGEAASSSKEFILETKQDVESLIPDVSQRLEQDPIFERQNNFGAQVAGETQRKAVLATVLSWGAMIVYLGFRFKNVSYGFAAVVALIHDVLMALGAVAVGGWVAQWLAPVLPGLGEWIDFKIDLTIISAFLTIIGFSVNDTIVTFDRLREIRGKTPYVTADMINASVNQCMGRTILTTFTVVLVIAIMYIWGGPGIRGFSYAMLIGTVSGCYSTIFIAAPILIMFAGKPQSAPSSKGMPLPSRSAAARA